MKRGIQTQKLTPDEKLMLGAMASEWRTAQQLVAMAGRLPHRRARSVLRSLVRKRYAQRTDTNPCCYRVRPVVSQERIDEQLKQLEEAGV